MIAFLASLLVVGGWFFWLLLGFDILFALIACKKEEDWATGWATVFLVILAVMFGPHLYHWLTWKWFLGAFVGWFIIGAPWALVRWNKWCRQAREKYDNSSQSTTDYTNARWDLNPALHKAEIYRWIVFWPFSMLIHAFGDILDTIYDCISTAFTRIAEHHMKGMKDPDTK